MYGGLCVYAQNDTASLLLWIPIIVMEQTLVGLIIFKKWEQHRIHVKLKIETNCPSIFTRIVQGSTIYFIVYSLSPSVYHSVKSLTCANML